jgi:uncharacterized protein YkwD
MTYRILVIIIVSIFLVFGCKSEEKKSPEKPPIFQQKIKTDLEKSQEKLLDLHNTDRSLRGVKNLVLDKNLCEYAQKHAEKMAEKDSLYHSKMKDLMKVNDPKIVGENIAWGQKDENSVFEGWMNSILHRWNILGEKYKKAGFGLAKDKNGDNYWCSVFSD